MSPYYEQDGIVIYHGDCLAVMDALHPDRGPRPCYDLLLTDPPYGIGFAAQPTKWQRRAGQQPVGWDDETSGVRLSAARSLARHQIVFGGNYYELPPARCILSWFKPDAPPSMGNVEYAWTNLKQNSRQLSISISQTIRDRDASGAQCLRCLSCWKVLPYPETDVSALRAEQQRQREQIALARSWKREIRASSPSVPRLLPWPGRSVRQG